MPARTLHGPDRVRLVRVRYLGFLMPRPWNGLAVLLNLPLLLSIPRMNLGLARARTEDESATG